MHVKQMNLIESELLMLTYVKRSYTVVYRWFLKYEYK